MTNEYAIAKLKELRNIQEMLVLKAPANKNVRGRYQKQRLINEYYSRSEALRLAIEALEFVIARS